MSDTVILAAVRNAVIAEAGRRAVAERLRAIRAHNDYRFGCARLAMRAARYWETLPLVVEGDYAPTAGDVVVLEVLTRRAAAEVRHAATRARAMSTVGGAA
jgi:hypothetical protein